MNQPKEICEGIFATLPLHLQQCIIAIVQELGNATNKHPCWPVKFDKARLKDIRANNDFIDAAAIVSEESGELIKAALQFKHEDGMYYEMQKEAIQVAAVALRFIYVFPEITTGICATNQDATRH